MHTYQNDVQMLHVLLTCCMQYLNHFNVSHAWKILLMVLLSLSSLLLLLWWCILILILVVAAIAVIRNIVSIDPPKAYSMQSSALVFEIKLFISHKQFLKHKSNLASACGSFFFIYKWCPYVVDLISRSFSENILSGNFAGLGYFIPLFQTVSWL